LNPKNDVYKKLALHLDKMPIAFPSTESGVELRILKHFFTPEEAEIALHLSALPESTDKIYRRVKKTGISKEKLEETLDRLVSKGSILGGKLFKIKGKKKYYSKAHLAVGMYEFQVNRLTRTLVDYMGQYTNEAYAEAFITPETSQLKTIPIESSFTPEHNIATYDDIRQLVMETEGKIAVYNCICKQENIIQGKACKKTERQEICIGFNEVAEHAIDNIAGRSISKDECLQILKQNEKDGLILQPANVQKPNFLCSCCSCCCGVLKMLKKFPRPAEYWHSNYFAEVRTEDCSGCKICVKRCSMEAISIKENVASANLARCIGCGLCTSTCKTKAIRLKKKPRETVPAKDHFSLYRKIMLERLNSIDKIKILGKAMIGSKI
jgi:formate hydrogenlyase subunit 6/NADH:ubiquinone oxidoreductase subunit I